MVLSCRPSILTGGRAAGQDFEEGLQGVVLPGAYWWVPQAGLQVRLGEGPLQFNVGTEGCS